MLYTVSYSTKVDEVVRAQRRKQPANRILNGFTYNSATAQPLDTNFADMRLMYNLHECGIQLYVDILRVHPRAGMALR